MRAQLVQFCVSLTLSCATSHVYNQNALPFLVPNKTCGTGGPPPTAATGRQQGGAPRGAINHSLPSPLQPPSPGAPTWICLPSAHSTAGLLRGVHADSPAPRGDLRGAPHAAPVAMGSDEPDGHSSSAAATAAATAASVAGWRAAACAFLRSERAAWAAQNAVGALFAAIFTVILDLQFTLACLCAVLFRCVGGGRRPVAGFSVVQVPDFCRRPAAALACRSQRIPTPPLAGSASSLVLSLDRSVGGRLFGGIVFVGTVMAGTALGERSQQRPRPGHAPAAPCRPRPVSQSDRATPAHLPPGGGLVALAWLARGDGNALVDYLPAPLRDVPDLPTLGKLQDAFARFAAVRLPPPVQDLVRGIGLARPLAGPARPRQGCETPCAAACWHPPATAPLMRPRPRRPAHTRSWIVSSPRCPLRWASCCRLCLQTTGACSWRWPQPPSCRSAWRAPTATLERRSSWPSSWCSSAAMAGSGGPPTGALAS